MMKQATKRRNNKGGTRPDLASLIDLYILRCRVEAKSPRTVSAHGETLRR